MQGVYMNKDELIEKIKILNKRNKTNLLLNLENRKMKELEFHNKNRDERLNNQLSQDMYEELHGNKKFYTITQTTSNYIDNWIKKFSKGKVFLDYACGNGINAIKAAKSGAKLSIGLDVSDVSIKNAVESAKKNNVTSNSYFLQADAENTGLPDNCIDVCICSGMLHHLDLSYAFPELRRILKKGGKILAIEALDYNPLIKLYRNLTPEMRTDWEKAHILSYKDINFAKRFFDVKDVRHWHLFSIAGVYFPVALPLFRFLDSFLLKLPVIKLMSWMFTFELHKKD
jgi:ubiquinone/menaquinone biosynthesis C-methylase UbiE